MEVTDMNYPENDYRNYLEHSSKGQRWKKHKYLAIINGRYIYPDTSSDVEETVGDRFNKALAQDLKNSYYKQLEARTNNKSTGVSIKYGNANMSKIAQRIKGFKSGGRTTGRHSKRSGSYYGGSGRKF